METTQLYIELIIIGLEASIWMCIFYINIVGNKIMNIITNIVNNLGSSLLLIGILYIIGVLVDRLADVIFQKTENNIRSKSGMKAKSSIIIWGKNNQSDFANYARTRIRILRASIINIPLIMISVVWYTLEYYEWQTILVIYILSLGILFTYVAWHSFVKLVEIYYDKARVLEMNDSKHK